MEKMLKFPENFLWGSSTSAYQVEGGIENCDWSKFYPAGKACDHYRRYEEDFDIAKSLNQNVHRFSIEWSRVEPRPGEFDEKEIQHYRDVLLSLKTRGIKSMVTLWHWTNPLWLAEIGGWTNKKAIAHFERYAQVIIDKLGDLVDFWVVLNEPTVPFYHGYIAGHWPPQKRNIFLGLRFLRNLAKAHKRVYRVIHGSNPGAKVGIAYLYNYFEPYNKNSLLDKLLVFLCRYFHNHWFINSIKNFQDFLGVNYYYHDRLKFKFSDPRQNENKIISDIGWEVYPKGIYYVLKELKRYKKPIYITENGLADAKDKFRKDFIRDHLFWVHKAIEEGVDVRGYFHWSLMDNFEWGRDSGFEPRFGLVEIDYKTLRRYPRASAHYYAQICKNNYLEI